MKPLLNGSEAATLADLDEITNPHALRVNPKVRMADVLPIDRSGISRELYSYALRAHFDFVVTTDQHMPEFAVEFDGPLHEEPHGRARDEKKDQLCRHFNFPLLRIEISYLPKIYRGKINLLRWIIEVYYMQKAFAEAQEAGQIPYEEPFDPFMIIGELDQLGSGDWKQRFPYWLSVEANMALQKLHREGKIACPGPKGFTDRYANGRLMGFEYIRINETHGVIVEMSMRPQLFPGVCFYDLLSELLLVSVHEKVSEYLLTGVGLTPLAEIDRVIGRYEANCKGFFFLHGWGGNEKRA